MLRRILILTDHEYLYERLRAVIEGSFPGLLTRIDFFCSPQNDFLQSIDVEAESDRIMENYGCVFSVHCRQIFPLRLVRNVLCVNLHPGFNPYHRGWFPHVFSIISGKPAGATLHVMDEKIDHGKIIDQIQVEVESYETSGEVYRKILAAEVELFKKHCLSIAEGDYRASSPAEEGDVNTQKSFDRIRQLDLNERGTFRDFLNRLRALTHDDYRNAYFIDDKGRRVFVRIVLEPETRNSGND